MAKMVPCPAGSDCPVKSKRHRMDSQQYQVCLGYSKHIKAGKVNSVSSFSDEFSGSVEPIDTEGLNEDLYDIARSLNERFDNIYSGSTSLPYDYLFLQADLETDMDWSEDEIKDSVIAVEMSDILLESPDGALSDKQKKKIHELHDKLSDRPLLTPGKKYAWCYGVTDFPDDYSRNKRWASRGIADMILAEADRVERTPEELKQKREEKAVHSPRMTGLHESIMDLFNMEDPYGEYGSNADEYLPAAINEYVNADSDTSRLDNLGECDMYVLDPYERVAKALKDNDNLYNMAVFPDKHLAPKLEEYGVNNVFVSPFYNNRELGNVYTVKMPNGNTMSFSMYEHRNSDDIIINGKQDWDGEELPYASEYKHDYIASFRYNDRDGAADSLAKLLKEAQEGDVPEIAQPDNNMSGEDHEVNLNEPVPGSEEWYKNNFPGR